MTFEFYKNLLSIEILKDNLPEDKYIIMEPGPIMFFLQDYFYVNEKFHIMRLDYLINYFSIMIF